MNKFPVVKRMICLLCLLLLPLTSFSQFDENPVKWRSRVESDKFILEASISPSWHIYDLGPYESGPNATSISFTLPDGVFLVGDVTSDKKVKTVFEEAFDMNVSYYENSAVFTQTLNNKTLENQTVVAKVEWQACNDMACMPPAEEEFTFQIAPSVVVSKESAAVTDSSGKSLLAVIIEAVLWGFAALLTPCVFPMVPMTVSFFIKGNKTPRKGRLQATVYGISIVALYTIPIALIIALTYLIGGDVVTADIFNWLSTHWLPNLLFFAIFMVFAISFFGAFEITLPSKFVNDSDAKADKGGLAGVFFMALTLVLVSFSCTGPIVGTILVKSTQGQIWEPVVTMLAFSVAFALPFTFFAFFPSILKKLPKSGGWLNTVKVTLGFLELALGMKFLSVADQTYHWGILDREVYLAIWIVIFSMLGFYLLGKLRFAYDDAVERITVKRLLLSIIVFSFVVYMIPGMWGAPLKALSGYMPPLSSQDFRLANPGYQTDNHSQRSESKSAKVKYGEFLRLPHELDGFFDYDEAVAYAKAVGKPLFIDFTGHGCVNCREMEANVWSDQSVLSILRNDYVVVALYVDDKMELPQSEWVVDTKGKTLKTLGKVNAMRQISMFGTNAQPYYCLVDPETQKLLVAPRSYSLDIEGFVDFLEAGLSSFGK